ncbi:SDR family NAD(P)-dependent oxidoreductase [Legionella maioricensis]|uniref:Glucose 1-dehydrogenase n=1 Tax=Legionella maioricensis TaxID=2896528 RepID=A0A9X2I869_9GAMM|nr:glucose 1-dehydrogenase [Legionella maioricensis]MCL9682609.1 glucose 1-dehydrogenase [Legionella maioricensis]MCL9686144.1 glucose 1-dehydrogenase [Legionella maioricensis]
MKKLAGNVALVTGASKGIGAEIATRLAEEGASVAVNYSSSKEDADRVVTEIIKQGGKAIAIKANLTDPQDIENLISETKNAFGPINILVNNAGIYEFSPLDAITPEHFHKQFNLNVLGLLLVSQAAVRHFHSDGGCIINISSAASTLTPLNSAVYSATKASVDAITSVLSKELVAKKIRVNAINPGMIVTEGLKAAGMNEGEMHDGFISIIPMGRVGTVKEIASAVLFFASSEASYITGETLHVSGGVR